MYKRKKHPFTLVSIFIMISVMTACGGPGNDTSDEPEPTSPSNTAETVDWWDVAIPELAPSNERPVISLIGSNTLILSIGEEYEELGANVSDPQEGNINSSLTIQNDVNTEVIGDYLVQYSAVDENNNAAKVVTRVVRVIDDVAVDYSKRPLGSTAVNMGYVEHLPDSYGLESDTKYPLIIYNHGNGANAEFSQTGLDNALDLVLFNYGPPTLLRAGRWDSELPFIVLMPQYGYIEDSNAATRLKHFMDFAVDTYQVDPDRVYMMGWSQGGFYTLEYAMTYPETLAAVISISAGTPFIDQPPAHFCQLESLPVWAFHGELDRVIPSSASTNLIELMNANCQPNWSPKVTVFTGEAHEIHHFVADLSAMPGGMFEYAADANFDAYDISIYDWLMSYTKAD